MRRTLALAAAAALLVAAGCDDSDDADEAGQPKRQKPTVAVAATLASNTLSAAERFELDEGSVQQNGAEVTAVYADPRGGSVTLRLVTNASPDAASQYLDEQVLAKEAEEFQTLERRVARSGGPLVVMSRSPGVQARPPDFAHLWTDGAVFAAVEGIGDAPGRLYDALPTFTPAPAAVGKGLSTPVPESEDFLDGLPEVERPSGPPLSSLVGSQGKTTDEWVTLLAEDVGGFWQGAFASNDANYVPATLSIFSKPLSTPDCGRQKPREGPLYCNHKLFFGRPWLRQNVEPIGDTAFAVIVAHETGHNVQHQLGTLATLSNLQIELQADCFAGLWAASVFERRLLEPGDIEEAMTVLAAAGDLPGTVTDDPHGTPQQRVDAFFQGYNDGLAGTCKAEELPS